MSGIVNDEVRERAARVQSADVLSKPFAADDLLRKLDVLLALASKAPAPEPPPAFTVAPALAGTNGHAASVPAPAPPPRAVTPPPPVAPRPPPPAPAPPPAAPVPAGATGPSAAPKPFVALAAVQWAGLSHPAGLL